MSYDYSAMKQTLFTEDGQRTFLKVRDHTHKLLRMAGACRAQEMMAGANGGDSWELLACVDRLVELGEIREVSTGGFAQHRVFVQVKSPEAQ